jgi:uncharacterized protein YjbJ (UPF0337 family)
MGGKTDVVKGRIEEAAGALTGDDKLRDKGKTDQAVGQAKQAATKAVDKAKDVAQKAVDTSAVTHQPLAKKSTIMGGKTDVVKGRIEEAAGALTGDDKLRDKGKTDQAVGQAEQAVAKAVDKAKDVAQKAVDKAKGVT